MPKARSFAESLQTSAPDLMEIKNTRLAGAFIMCFILSDCEFSTRDNPRLPGRMSRPNIDRSIASAESGLCEKIAVSTRM